MTVLINRTYRFLMDKFGWTTGEIDKLDFFRTLELISADFEENESEGEVFIDQILGS